MDEPSFIWRRHLVFNHTVWVLQFNYDQWDGEKWLENDAELYQCVAQGQQWAVINDAGWADVELVKTVQTSAGCIY